MGRREYNKAPFFQLTMFLVLYSALDAHKIVLLETHFCVSANHNGCGQMEVLFLTFNFANAANLCLCIVSTKSKKLQL